MADDLTPGEIRRSIERVERALQQIAAESVPAKLWAAQVTGIERWQSDHAAASAEVHARLERDIKELRKAHEADVTSLRDGLNREIDQAREENRAQIDALKRDRETRSEFTWQRVVGLITVAVALAGVIVAALAASKGIH